MRAPRFYYHSSNYISHDRVSRVYREILRTHCELVADGNEAEIVILHHEPHNFEAIYRAYPELKNKYVIGYCVWETDELPETYKRSLTYIQEVWTASRYCCKAFSKYHNQVAYMPHVIERDISYSDRDRAYIEEAIDYDKDCVYFLAVSKVGDPRKNARGLIDAFLNVRAKLKKARLLIKSWPADSPDFIADQQIIHLRENLSAQQLNALYDLSNVYVSPHHSEGWGLTLSDAMIFKKPVIATAYSGNMEFMSEENSFLLDFEETYIRPQDCNALFKNHMKWAYPEQADIEAKLCVLYEQLHEAWVAEKVERAFEDTKKFDRYAVGQLIHKRIDELRGINLRRN